MDTITVTPKATPTMMIAVCTRPSRQNRTEMMHLKRRYRGTGTTAVVTSRAGAAARRAGLHRAHFFRNYYHFITYVVAKVTCAGVVLRSYREIIRVTNNWLLPDLMHDDDSNDGTCIGDRRSGSNVLVDHSNTAFQIWVVVPSRGLLFIGAFHAVPAVEHRMKSLQRGIRSETP